MALVQEGERLTLEGHYNRVSIFKVVDTGNGSTLYVAVSGDGVTITVVDDIASRNRPLQPPAGTPGA